MQVFARVLGVEDLGGASVSNRVSGTIMHIAHRTRASAATCSRAVCQVRLDGSRLGSCTRASHVRQCISRSLSLSLPHPHRSIDRYGCEMMIVRSDVADIERLMDGWMDGLICRWCPQTNCGNVMVVLDPSLPMVVCSNKNCNFTYCRKCNRQWHADMTCEQYANLKADREAADERAYEEWVRSHAKPCPSCHANIEVRWNDDDDVASL